MAQNATLFFAYGNPDRQDDGAGWVTLQALAQKFGHRLDDPSDDFYSELGRQPDFFFSLQLLPEQMDLVREYTRVCFLDAHFQPVDDSAWIQRVAPIQQTSMLTHVLSPGQFLYLYRTCYQTAPEAILVSIPGHQFGYGREISEQTAAQIPSAVKGTLQWYHDADFAAWQENETHRKLTLS